MGMIIFLDIYLAFIILTRKHSQMGGGGEILILELHFHPSEV